MDGDRGAPAAGNGTPSGFVCTIVTGWDGVRAVPLPLDCSGGAAGTGAEDTDSPGCLTARRTVY
jgi:hypothetical protein